MNDVRSIICDFNHAKYRAAAAEAAAGMGPIGERRALYHEALQGLVASAFTVGCQIVRCPAIFLTKAEQREV